MKSFYLSYNGKSWNEDFAFSNEKLAIVLDGASGISNQKYSDFDSDAMWYSNTLGNYLVSELQNSKKDLLLTLKKGVNKLKDQFLKMSKNSEIIDFPSATISLARVNDDIELYTLSDSTILVEDIYGQVFEMRDTRNNINDDIAMSYMLEVASKENTSLSEAAKKHSSIIKERRELRNSIGHQYVLADNSEAVDQGIHFKMPLRLTKKVIILSDGFSQCFDLFKFISKENFVKKINCENDGIKIYKKLFKFQEKDQDCKKYWRFKKRDDASIACLLFD